jgi:hypothetical protein
MAPTDTSTIQLKPVKTDEVSPDIEQFSGAFSRKDQSDTLPRE